MTTTTARADFTLDDHGSLVLLTANTDDARAHLDAHMPDDAPRLGNAYAIQPRFVCAILEDLVDAGFTVGGA